MSFDDASTSTPTPALSRFGVLLPFPGTASSEDADTGTDETGMDAQADLCDGQDAMDWEHIGGVLLDLVLRMRPSAWRCAIQLSLFDPCDLALGLIVRTIAAVRSDLPVATLTQCQRGDRSPVEVWADLRRRADGRCIIVDIAPRPTG